MAVIGRRSYEEHIRTHKDDFLPLEVALQHSQPKASPPTPLFEDPSSVPGAGGVWCPQLKQIQFTDLQFEQRRPGCYVSGTLVGRPFYMCALHLLVEFGPKLVTRLSVYNLRDIPVSQATLDKRFPENMQIFKDKFDGLRVDDPQFVTFGPFSPEDFRLTGNKWFKLKKFELAKEAYSTAIKLDPQDNLSLCNRAAAYLEIDDAANALADATRCATLSPQFVKAHVRKAMALKKLNRHSEAILALKEAKKLSPDNKEIDEMLKSLANNVHEPLKKNASKQSPLTENSMSKKESQQKRTLALSVTLQSWSQVPHSKFWPRVGRAISRCVCMDDNQILIWGGISGEESQENQIFTSMYEYDLKAIYVFDAKNEQFYTPLSHSDGPTSSNAHTLTRVGDCAYLIGGYLSGVWKLDFKHEFKWLKISNFRTPFPILQAATSIRENIFIFGGRSAEGVQMTNDLYVFNTSTNACTKYSPTAKLKWPSPRSACVLAAFRDRYLLLFGGDRGSSSTNNETWIFDTVSQNWSLLSPKVYPSSRGVDAYTTAIGKNRKEVIIIYGGTSISGKQFSDTWAFDTETCEWVLLPTSSGEANDIVQPTVAYANGNLYRFFGYMLAQFKTTTSVIRFPIQEYIEYIAANPTETSPKWCAACNSFTLRKCSKCSAVPFCSEACEDVCKLAHKEECWRLGGMPDPKLEEIKKLTQAVEKLSAALSEQEAKCTELIQQQQREKDNKKKKELRIAEQQELIQQLNATNEYFKKLAAVEAFDKQKVVEEKKQMEVKLSLRAMHVECLEADVQIMTKDLREAADKADAQRKIFEAELEKNGKLQAETRQGLVYMQESLKSLRQELHEKKESEKCTICLDATRDHVLGCGHVFCKPCVDALRVRHCPICSKPISSCTKLFMA